jgi:hypothetical protein
VLAICRLAVNRPASFKNKNPSADAADGFFPAENGLRTTAKYLEAISSRKPVDYFNDVLMVEKLVLRVEPTPLTAAMIARLMPAAIRQYSIAVAADSSAQNFARIFFTIPPGIKVPILRVPPGNLAAKSLRLQQSA